MNWARRSIALSALIHLLICGCRRDGQPEAAAAGQTDLRETLADLVEHAEALDQVSFAVVIEGTTGRAVLPIEPGDAVGETIIRVIGEAVSATLPKLSATDSPLRQLRRINEASRYFEDEILAHLDRLPEFSCARPTTASGRPQRSGYPDLKLTHLPSGRVAYLDPKLFEQGSRESSFRSFYYQPKNETNKVLEDAHHLLVGIEHDGVDRAWQFKDWHLVDLSRLKVRLKPEFQASNRALYGSGAVISSDQPDTAN